MNIKNYISSIPIEKSVYLIENLLVKIGTTHIAKVYDEDILQGITFQIMQNGKPSYIFKLPAKQKAVEKLFHKQMKRPHEGTKERLTEQAKRTAWKLLYDWVALQCSMVLLEQAEIIEVFLPYALDK